MHSVARGNIYSRNDVLSKSELSVVGGRNYKKRISYEVRDCDLVPYFPVPILIRVSERRRHTHLIGSIMGTPRTQTRKRTFVGQGKEVLVPSGSVVAFYSNTTA